MKKIDQEQEPFIVDFWWDYYQPLFEFEFDLIMAPDPEETTQKLAETMEAMQNNFLMQAATLHIPFFDGKNIPLRQFIQDVENGLTVIPDGLKPAFRNAVHAKLKGLARDSLEKADTDTTEKLLEELKKYFSPGRKYSDLVIELQNTRM